MGAYTHGWWSSWRCSTSSSTNLRLNFLRDGLLADGQDRCEVGVGIHILERQRRERLRTQGRHQRCVRWKHIPLPGESLSGQIQARMKLNAAITRASVTVVSTKDGFLYRGQKLLCALEADAYASCRPRGYVVARVVV